MNGGAAAFSASFSLWNLKRDHMTLDVTGPVGTVEFLRRLIESSPA
jgi:hypothetical protein